MGLQFNWKQLINLICFYLNFLKICFGIFKIFQILPNYYFKTDFSNLNKVIVTCRLWLIITFISLMLAHSLKSHGVRHDFLKFNKFLQLSRKSLCRRVYWCRTESKSDWKFGRRMTQFRVHKWNYYKFSLGKLTNSIAFH